MKSRGEMLWKNVTCYENKNRNITKQVIDFKRKKGKNMYNVIMLCVFKNREIGS